MLLDREHGLRSQHQTEVRRGYDGHNRRSGLISMHCIRGRIRRRREHQRLAALANRWRM